jgi:hypothetical protein
VGQGGACLTCALPRWRFVGLPDLCRLLGLCRLPDSMSTYSVNLDESTFSAECFQGDKLYPVGAIVWARFMSFAWWPGRIATPAEVHRSLKGMKHPLVLKGESKQYCVFFFGSRTYGWCDDTRLKKFCEPLTKTEKNIKKSQTTSKLFKSSVAEAKEFENGTKPLILDSVSWVASWPATNENLDPAHPAATATATMVRKGDKKRSADPKGRDDSSGKKAKCSVGEQGASTVQGSVAAVEVGKVMPTGMEDTLCFVCNTGGELICCDVPMCPRVYHVGCLRLRELPPDDREFVCPWHFCSACGVRDQVCFDDPAPDTVHLLRRPTSTVLEEVDQSSGSSAHDAGRVSVPSVFEQTKSMGTLALNPGAGMSRPVFFWYQAMSTLSFCTACACQQTFSFHLSPHVPFHCTVSPKAVEYFTPAYFVRALPSIRLNLILERIWGYVATNRLSQPFLQPLLAAVAPEDRYSLSKLADEPHMDLSTIGEKIRWHRYTSVKEFQVDLKAIAINCSLLCGGMYGPARVALMEAARTITFLCDEQLRAHRKILDAVEEDGTKETDRERAAVAAYPLRSYLCFPLLAPPTEAYESEASVGSAGMGRLKASSHAESNEGFPFGTKEAAYSPDVVVAMKNMKEYPMWSLAAWDHFVRNEKQVVGNDPAEVSAKGIVASTDPLHTIRSDEEIQIATVMATLEVPRPTHSDIAFSGRRDRHASSLLPEPVSKIQSLVEQQAHHMRAALLASRELQQEWKNTHRVFSRGSCDGSGYGGSGSSHEAAIVTIGDGDLIGEYRLANKNLKVMLETVRKKLVEETLLRKSLEEQLRKKYGEQNS